MFSCLSCFTIFNADDSLRSTTSALKASPKQPITGCLNLSTLAFTLTITHCGFASLISRAALISFAFSGTLATMNQGLSAMQCPPKPGLHSVKSKHSCPLKQPLLQILWS